MNKDQPSFNKDILQIKNITMKNSIGVGGLKDKIEDISKKVK
jgi:hypothetical protein